jgi:hypothetical protein
VASFDFYRAKVPVNQYYFYILDADWGPFFIKFSSYVPFGARLCINGHEWAKQQLKKRAIAYESLDNGFLSCEDPARLQAICDQLSADDVDRLFRRWLGRLPHPFSREDRAAGYLYQLSIWQFEFSMTHVFDRPLQGRHFFEEVLRDNLDLGRPDRIQLLFDRQVRRNTPSSFRTRVVHRARLRLAVESRQSRVKSPATRLHVRCSHSRPSTLDCRRGPRERSSRDRLKGLLHRLPRRNRYVLTPLGRRVALFFTKTYARILRPGHARLDPAMPADPTDTLNTTFRRWEQALDKHIAEAKVAA